MKINYLLPANWKPIGWILFLIGIILSMIYMITMPEYEFLDVNVFYFMNDGLLGKGTQFFGIEENNIFDEIAMITTLIGGVIVCFTKLKIEDEFINKIRMESLLWAVYVNYIILFFCILLFYDLTFFWVLIYNVFTPIVIFIIRFHWILWKSNKMGQDEE